MEKNVWLTAVLGASLASSGLTAVVLLGLGLTRDAPRVDAITEHALGTAKIEGTLERILERLEAMSLQSANAPVAVAPNRVSLDKPVDVSGLAEEIALLRRSLQQTSERAAGPSSVALAAELSRDLGPSSIDSLRLLGEQPDVQDRLTKEYRVRPAALLFERFGRPVSFSVESSGVVKWSWHRDGSPLLQAQVYDGLVKSIMYRSRD